MENSYPSGWSRSFTCNQIQKASATFDSYKITITKASLCQTHAD